MLATLDRRTDTRDPAYGFGMVNPRGPSRATVPSNAPNPVYAALDPFVAASAYQPKRLAVPAAAATTAPPGQFAVGGMPQAGRHGSGRASPSVFSERSPSPF